MKSVFTGRLETNRGGYRWRNLQLDDSPSPVLVACDPVEVVPIGDPFHGELDGLFVDFAGLADASSAEILDFWSKYGEPIQTFARSNYFPADQRRGGKIEQIIHSDRGISVEYVQRHAEKVKFLWESVYPWNSEAKPVHPSDLGWSLYTEARLMLQPPPGYIGGDESSTIKQLRDKHDVSPLVLHIVSRMLAHRQRVIFTPGSKGDGRTRGTPATAEISYYGVVDCSLAQLALAVLERHEFVQCEVCKKWIRKKTRRTLCSAACRSEQYRQRRAKADHLWRLGKTVPEIAREIEVDIDLVQKWLTGD